MILVVVLFAGLITLGLSGRTSVHPAAASLNDIASVESIECRENTGPDSQLDAPPANRTSGFKMTGTYACHRPVFAADERNPFVERVLAAQNARAKQVASNIKAQLPPNTLLTVKVEGLDEPRLRDRVAALYRVELNAVLGPGHLRRGLSGDDEVPQLTIYIEKSDVPELMSKARLKVQNGKGEVVWLTI